MAQIMLGMGVSHTPQLHTPAEQWDIRVEADRRNKAHQYRGRTYDWDGLKALRQTENLGEQAQLAYRQKRLERAHRSLEELARIFESAKPDVAVIVGNDQHELFDDSITPALTVFWGDNIQNVPRSQEQVARLPA